MTQLGKYSTDRDNILHFLCTSQWSNDSFGDVDSPTGYVYRISNDPADVHIPNTEVTSLIEEQLVSYDIEDSPEFRKTLEGHFLVTENSSGLVSVLEFATESELLSIYSELEAEYDAWASQDED